jgi:hypothetical protein
MPDWLLGVLIGLPIGFVFVLAIQVFIWHRRGEARFVWGRRMDLT